MFPNKQLSEHELHDYFFKPYENEIERIVFDELSSFIEKYFHVKVKKIAVSDLGSLKRLEVYLYSYDDWLKLEPHGIFTGEISQRNCDIISEAAKEIIIRNKALKHFSPLKRIFAVLHCFEDIERQYIAKNIFLNDGDIAELQKLMVGGDIVRACAPPPHSCLLLFFKNKDGADAFVGSQKEAALQKMIYQKAKKLDHFDLINDINKDFWYKLVLSEDFRPHYNLQDYDYL